MRGLAPTLLVTLVFILAGCLSATEPQSEQKEPARIKAERVNLSDYSANLPKYSLKEIKPFVATAKDGTKLKGHVYLPNAPEPLATVLEYSPYFNGQSAPSDGHVQTVDGRRTMTGDKRAFMDAGYAVALVNLRGTGPSGSCFQWGTQQDWEDVSLVIETLAALPWSNGAIGMVGTSYPGWTQYMALASKAPSLKAVIPVSGLFDLHSLLSRNGATLSIGPVVTTQWNTLYSLGEATYLPIDSRGGEANHLDCGPRYAEDLRESAALYAVGDRNQYWNDRDIRDEVAESNVPILFTNGMTNGEGHILQFEGLWESIKHQDKRMLIGQWGHGSPQAPPQDWPTMRLAWFDHYLRGGPPLLETGIVEYQDDARFWHTSDNWPPAHRSTPLFLSERSLVADATGVKASTQTFQSIHANPCLGLCTADLVNTPNVGACGPFQALYVSPPLKNDVLLAGNFHVNLTLTSNLPDGNFAAFLYRTSGSGACPDIAAKEVRRALTDLRHARAPGHAGADFPVGAPTSVNLISHPFAAPIKAGERFVLAIGGGSLELTPEFRHPVLTVTTGTNLKGQVTLPVVEGTLEFQGQT